MSNPFKIGNRVTLINLPSSACLVVGFMNGAAFTSVPSEFVCIIDWAHALTCSQLTVHYSLLKLSAYQSSEWPG